MIQTLAILLGRVLQLPFLAGYRTVIAAVGMVCLAIYLITAGQTEAGLTNLFFALGLLGIRFQFTPAKPILPGAEPEDVALLVEATSLDEKNLDLPLPNEPKVIFGAMDGPAKTIITDAQRASRRRDRRQQAIDGLRKAGVSNAGILAWLPIVIALLQIMPDVAAVIAKILDAIRNGRTPSQVAKAERLTA